MILFLRHGRTQGNLEGRYVGRTDEPLCAAGREELRARRLPPVERVFVSPLRRCLETAACLYPRVAPLVVPDFREIDFGAFEYKNHRELDGDPDYQAWIDSGGALPFPGGESRADFCRRCRAAFAALQPALWGADCALIVHGGTIMAILERWGEPRRGYFDYQVANGHGYLAEPVAQDGLRLTKI